MSANGKPDQTARNHTCRFSALVCLVACLLVAHLVDRYPSKANASVGRSTHSRSPHDSWQRLQSDAARWVAPSRKAEPFRPTVVCDLIEFSAEDQLPQMALDESLFNRPPPSC